MVSTLRVGCRVQGAVGPFNDRLPGERCQRRAKWTGTIIASASEQRWTVLWDEIEKCFDHRPRTLSLLSSQELSTSVDVEAVLQNSHLGLYHANTTMSYYRRHQREM